MACEVCDSEAPPEQAADDHHYCPDCGTHANSMAPDLSAGETTVTDRGMLGTDFTPRNHQERQLHRHHLIAMGEVSEKWIVPIKQDLARMTTSRPADRAFDLIRRANRAKPLGPSRYGLGGLRGIPPGAGRTDYRRLVWALAALDVLSEIETTDYNVDSLCLELGVPPHDRNWAVRIIRPPRGYTSEDPDEISRQIERNTLKRARQTSHWLEMSEERLRILFPSKASTEVTQTARRILREEWGQPVYEGDPFEVHPLSNMPPRRVAAKAVLEAMRRHPGFERIDRTAFWNAFPSKGTNPDSAQ